MLYMLRYLSSCEASRRLYDTPTRQPSIVSYHWRWLDNKVKATIHRDICILIMQHTDAIFTDSKEYSIHERLFTDYISRSPTTWLWTNTRQTQDNPPNAGRHLTSLRQFLDNNLQLMHRRLKTHGELQTLQHITADSFIVSRYLMLIQGLKITIWKQKSPTLTPLVSPPD